MRKIKLLRTRQLVALSASALLFCALPDMARASVDLADVPIAMNRDNASLVRPNIAFIVDDSGSMNDQNMPNDDGTNKSQNCWGWRNYNTLAYDPTYEYKPPYHPDTSRYPNNRLPNASFTNALEDGYFPYNGVTFAGGSRTNVRRDLSSRSNLPNTSYYYTTLPDGHARFDEAVCLDDDQYTRVRDYKNIRAPKTTPGSPAALQNYANWYSYYRRRAYLMKYSAGEAFRSLDDDTYRVGLFFINSNQSGATNTSGRNNDLKIDNFQGAHRVTWYDRLYGNRSNGWTPLRGALARAGRMYAGQIAGWDPVQYSCQQNFTLLSTDGYWNTNGETTGYRALQVNPGGGTAQVGDVDGRTVNINRGTPLGPPYVDNNDASNTLADIALYYYNTDLRNKDAFDNCTNRDKLTTADVCEDNVSTSGNQKKEKQHMVTYTLGLGVDGTFNYEAGYKDGPAEIMDGSKNWPSPHNSDSAKIDDLWHAAINGRGRYFSARNPTTLTTGLEEALATMRPQSGNAAAAASSSLEQGEDRVYVAVYRTEKWDGDVWALDIMVGEGGVTTIIEPPVWEAQKKLDTEPYDKRNILYLSAGRELKPFTYANLSSDGKGGDFANFCGKIPRPAQCGSALGDLSDADKALANDGANLVNYLRGSRAHENKESNSAEKLYRGRDHVLGDIVHSNPEYVKFARFNYADPRYQEFKAGMVNRKPQIYVGSNDGMLHAFDATTGEEKWAYVPGMVMPNMWRLADRNYQHRYFIDGPITVSDICTNVDPVSKQCASKESWKTILVSGMGKGGCGYFALDITNPDEPVGMWEISSSTPGMQNMGFSYGNPLITMNKEGKWVVIFSSGYNNIPGNTACAGGNGDGNGHVYVVGATDGNLITSIPTLIANGDGTSSPAGTTATPSGLGKLNVWIKDPTVPVGDRVYGGDLLGNVWRVDFDNNYAHSKSVRLAVLKDHNTPNPILQPITTRPELGTFRLGTNTYDFVAVGSGKLLGESDLNNVSRQSLYVLKEEMGSSGIADVRSGNFMHLGLVRDANGRRTWQPIAGASGAAMNWSSMNGWLLDFNLDGEWAGERINVNMELVNVDGRLQLWFGTNVPRKNPCDVGGVGIEYEIDVIDPLGDGVNAGTETFTTFITGLKAHTTVTETGERRRYRVTTGADGSIRIETDVAPPAPQPPPPPPPPVLRRTAWREIIME